MNQKAYNQLVKENRLLFWWVAEGKLKNLSQGSVVEAILNLGTVDSVKKLFKILGIKQVAKIFHQKTSGPRTNYYPEVINYFKLYFARHA
jgi:hypothetical protein